MIKYSVGALRFKLWTLRPSWLLIPKPRKETTTMAPKAVKVYTVEELKAKCQDALVDPDLVSIAGLYSPSRSHDSAFHYAVYDKEVGLQTAKKLAVATRFLAILRRDHREEFEKLIARKELPKPQSTKTIYDFRFDLPPDAELITKEIAGVSKKIAVRFVREHYLIIFLREIIAALREVGLPSSGLSTCEKHNLQSEIIQLLEEKFGLKVKVCGNCKYIISAGRGNPDIYCRMACNTKADKPEGFGHNAILVHEFDSTCEHWTPKEN